MIYEYYLNYNNKCIKEGKYNKIIDLKELQYNKNCVDSHFIEEGKKCICAEYFVIYLVVL